MEGILDQENSYPKARRQDEAGISMAFSITRSQRQGEQKSLESRPEKQAGLGSGGPSVPVGASVH